MTYKLDNRDYLTTNLIIEVNPWDLVKNAIEITVVGDPTPFLERLDALRNDVGILAGDAPYR